MATISAYDFGYVDSGAAANNHFGADVQLDSEAAATKMGILQFNIPTLESLELTSKSYISTITIGVTVTVTGDTIEIYKVKDSVAGLINFRKMSFASYNQEGQAADLSHRTWDPSNWQENDLADDSDKGTIVEGNMLDSIAANSTAVKTLTLSDIDLAAAGYTFGSKVTLAFYCSGTNAITLTQNNVAITLNDALNKPDAATMTLAANRNGTTGDFTVSIPNDSTISGFYIDMATSSSVSATASPDFTSPALNTVVNSSSFTGTFTQGVNQFVRVFTINANNTGTNATGGTELLMFRPKIKTSTGALLYTDSALSSALGSATENLTIGQKVYLKIITDSVSTPTSNKFTKIRVNWDSATSDTDDDYVVYEMSDLTPVHNNGSNTVVSHVYSTGGAKVVKVQIEDENGFRSDKQNVDSHQPNITFGFPTAVISPSVTKVTQAKYGDRTTALTLSGQHSRTSGADITIEQYLWGYVPQLSTTIVTANALENDNSVFDDGSHRVKIGGLSTVDVSDTVFKIFGLASFDSAGDSVPDTATNFDHYAFVSATASPSYDIDARPNYGSLAVSGSDEIYFKEIECVVCITKDGSENKEITDCKRYLLATNAGEIINKDLFFDTPVANSIVDSGSNVNETLSATDDVITITGSGVAPADIIKVDNEIMFVEALTSSDILVERGYNNTTAAAHASGTDIYVYRFANRYKWGGHAMIRGASSGFIDFSDAGKITIQNTDSNFRSGVHEDWFENNFFIGDIIKVGNDNGSNGTYASPKFFKLKSFIRDTDGDGSEDGNHYNVALIETDAANLTEEERGYVSTSITTDADENADIIRHDSVTKPSITCAVFNSADAQDNTTFHLATIDSTSTRFDATDRGSTSDAFNFQFNWSETTTTVISITPETLDLDTLADANNIAIEKVNLTRSGGISAQMPLGIRRYPVGVTRTKLGIPKVSVQVKALDQTGYRALFSLVEGNRYDYVFLDSKKLDSPSTSYRTLRMRLESGNITKDVADPNVYLANLSFVILGEDVS